METPTLQRLIERFDEQGFRSWHDRLGERDALVARRSEFRWAWVATRLHVFVFVLSLPTVAVNEAEQLTQEASEYAIAHKGGLPRGLQTGSAAVLVFLAPHADEQVLRWASQEPRQRFGALSLPVVVDETAGTLTFYRGRWKRGWVYAGYVTDVVETTVGAVVSSS
jgi:hypothetical protein